MKKRTHTSYPSFMLAAIMFGVVSAVTSGIGAYNLLLNFMPATKAIPLATSFTVVVQISILLLVFGMVQQLPKTTKTWIYLGYFVLVFLSVSTAAGMWWKILRASDFEQEVNHERLNTILVPLGSINQSVLSFSNVMNEVADFAELRADNEAKHGDSCERGIKPGRGSRYNLRMKHSNEATAYSQKALLLSDNINKIFSSTSVKKINTKVLNEAYSQANRTLSGSPIMGIRTWAENASYGYKYVFSGAMKDGSDLKCPDPEFARKLDSLIANIDRLPQLPNLPPRAKQVSTQEALLLSYKRMLPFFKEDTQTVAADKAIDYVSLVPATIVELLIYIFAHIRASLIRRDGAGPNQVGSFLNSIGPMDKESIEDMERFLRLKGFNSKLTNYKSIFELLERFLLPLGQQTYLVVPISENETTHMLMRLVLMLNLEENQDPDEILYQFPVKNLNDWFIELNSDALSDVKYVRLYPVDYKSINQWRRNTMRDYINNVKENDPPPPPTLKLAS